MPGSARCDRTPKWWRWTRCNSWTTGSWLPPTAWRTGASASCSRGSTWIFAASPSGRCPRCWRSPRSSISCRRSAWCAEARPVATSVSSTASRRCGKAPRSWWEDGSRTRRGAGIATRCRGRMRTRRRCSERGTRNGCTLRSVPRSDFRVPRSMLNVALTGNIAAGKSTVVDLFRRWGATIIDADELARHAQAPGGVVLAAIAQRFGADVLAPDGSLDRAALRGKVMGDQAALDALNSIVHPAVRRRRDELVREAAERGDVLVVNDIPLLFEVLDPAQFDAVV